jgi:hypothetical protein
MKKTYIVTSEKQVYNVLAVSIIEAYSKATLGIEENIISVESEMERYDFFEPEITRIFGSLPTTMKVS